MEELIRELEAFHFMLGKFIYNLKYEKEITGALRDHIIQIIYKNVADGKIEVTLENNK